MAPHQRRGFDDVSHAARPAGDTLHTQRNGFDSAYLFDVRANYSGGAQPIRILPEGRDTSATLDSLFGTAALSFTGAFNNEGSDNEVTGWHVSDGDPSVLGLLGAKIPEPFEDGWRVFFTQQHGDNFTPHMEVMIMTTTVKVMAKGMATETERATEKTSRSLDA